MTINIDIKRTGFPVKVEGVEFFFDASFENLRRFFNIEEITKEKVKKAQEKAQHIHFPEVIESIDDIEVETYDASFDVYNEFVAAQYDILFGDGSFKRIYEKCPDVLALDQALTIIGDLIGEKVEALEAERSEHVESKKSEYLQKKAQKR